jgi:hypothetical protein
MGDKNGALGRQDLGFTEAGAIKAYNFWIDFVHLFGRGRVLSQICINCLFYFGCFTYFKQINNK